MRGRLLRTAGPLGERQILKAPGHLDEMTPEAAKHPGLGKGTDSSGLEGDAAQQWIYLECAAPFFKKHITKDQRIPNTLLSSLTVTANIPVPSTRNFGAQE